MDDDVFEALRCCISDGKCRGCPREKTCGRTHFRNDTVEISKLLALDVINKLKELQEEVDDLSFQIYG